MKALFRICNGWCELQYTFVSKHPDRFEWCQPNDGWNCRWSWRSGLGLHAWLVVPHHCSSAPCAFSEICWWLRPSKKTTRTKKTASAWPATTRSASMTSGRSRFSITCLPTRVYPRGDPKLADRSVCARTRPCERCAGFLCVFAW